MKETAPISAPRAVAVQCTLCGQRRILSDTWATVYADYQKTGQRFPCFGTEGCEGALVAWRLG